ncbi:hypothetical protein [uncultured Pontibacter sp.]|uniref:hypothetical protein n=1 Tax=uncultured Pontibacter sp. TaxID=453356 RepID=UPI002624B8E0|nr:hypothetical protein [uncultured Pontibacter sp.]
MKQTRLTNDKDITVKGVTVGNLKDGDVIVKGTPLADILERILNKVADPTGSISSSISNIEIGTVLNHNITAAFNKNDGGDLTGFVLRRNSVAVINATALQTYNEKATIGNTAFSYQATFSYGAGASLPAGSFTSNTVTITGRRNAFYGVNGTVTTSANIRAFTGKLLNPANGSSFTIDIPAGATSVEFAYPDTLRDVTTVRHVETNFDVKEVFTKTLVNVEGANGFTAVGYKVYRYTPAVPFSAAQKYTITI